MCVCVCSTMKITRSPAADEPKHARSRTAACAESYIRKHSRTISRETKKLYFPSKGRALGAEERQGRVCALLLTSATRSSHPRCPSAEVSSGRPLRRCVIIRGFSDGVAPGTDSHAQTVLSRKSPGVVCWWLQLEPSSVRTPHTPLPPPVYGPESNQRT